MSPVCLPLATLALLQVIFHKCFLIKSVIHRYFKSHHGDFRGRLEVLKTLCFTAGGKSSISGWGTKIPTCSTAKKKKAIMHLMRIKQRITESELGMYCLWDWGQRGKWPGGASGKEPACQCRRHKRPGFDPWVEKIPWKRTRQPTPIFLPGESHGQMSLVGHSP